jgi:hypothetical protein
MHQTPSSTRGHLLAAVNGPWHARLLAVFTAVVVAHWLEHVVQAVQIFVLGMPRPKSLGLLGTIWPWLFTSEWLHYGFAVVMLVGLWLLAPGFTGRARQWWLLALGIQVWHHFEHLLLLAQAMTGYRVPGQTAPVSVLQLFVPRVELHLFYNAVVTVPMVIGAVLHRRRAATAEDAAACRCAQRRVPVPALP